MWKGKRESEGEREREREREGGRGRGRGREGEEEGEKERVKEYNIQCTRNSNLVCKCHVIISYYREGEEIVATVF